MPIEVFPLTSSMVGHSFLKTSPQRIWFPAEAEAFDMAQRGHKLQDEREGPFIDPPAV